MGDNDNTKPWLEQVKPELRESEVLKDVADVNDLVTRHIQTVGEFSKVKGEMGSMIKVPGESATAEERSAYLRSIGVPEKPEEYEIPVPKDQSTKLADWARGVFHKAGVTKEAAKVVTEEWNGFLSSMAAERERVRKETLETGMAELKNEWKDGFDGNVEIVKRVQGVVAEGNKAMGEWLTSHNAENDPVLIKFLYDLAPSLLPDFSKGKPDPTKLTKNEDGTFKYPDM